MINKIKPFLILSLALFLLSCSSAVKQEPLPTSSVVKKTNQKKIPVADLSLREKISEDAQGCIGYPYKWGGTTKEQGFDCSGLTFFAYQNNGVDLPRTAKSQFIYGETISLEELKVADLVFFSNPSSNKTFHVGIYVGNNQFVHSPGKGREVTYGSLYNPYFKDNYKGARSYL